MWDYTDKVKEYFLNPRNVGEIENADAIGDVGNLSCGDALRLTLKIEKETDTIIDAQFKTFGCASAIASSSALTEMIKGKTLDEALAVTNHDIADFLGGLPEEKMHCSVMGQEALEKAIKGYRGIPIEEEEEHDHHATIICKCFNVTDVKLKRVIMENELKTLEDVTHYCKAGGACGGCHAKIREIINEVLQVRDEKEEEATILKRPAGKMSNLQKIRLIEDAINAEIRSYLHRDGGDIELVDVDGDAVFVRLHGRCAQCVGASQTLKNYVEKVLRDKVVPEITVVNVDDK